MFALLGFKRTLGEELLEFCSERDLEFFCRFYASAYKLFDTRFPIGT